MITIFCWYWTQPSGRTRYTPFHVNLWAAKVRQNLTIPARIACVTHEPEGIDGSIEIIRPPREFENVRIPTWGEKYPQCLRRLVMFRPDAAEWFGERFVSMDMDAVILGNLDSLFTEDVDFRMYKGTASDRPYNGSMIMMRAGARPHVYADFTPEKAAEAGERFVGSDQAWISHILGWGERTWGPDDGVYWWSEWRRKKITAEPKIVFFPGKPKPWAMEMDDPVIRAHYRFPKREGKCLILGYAPNVWAEALKAQGPFEAVVASPEASKHRHSAGWRWGDIAAIGKSDEHCLHLAHMLGFDESQIVFCGRQGRR